MKRSLRKMRRRIRLVRSIYGILLGLLCAAAGGFAVVAVSFFTPIEAAWRYPALLAGTLPLFGALIGGLLPVSIQTAARRADDAGLKERARTAVELESQDTPMTRLQRADAQAALQRLQPKEAVPIRPRRWIWIGTLSLAVGIAVLLIVPNPQDAMLRARRTERQALQAQAQEVEEAAERIAQEGLTQDELRELRRITGEMAEAMRTARDKRDALEAVDARQKELERLQDQIRSRQYEQTAQALAMQPGLKSLSQGMQSGSQSEIQDALNALAQAMEASTEEADSLAEQLSAAALESPTDAIQQALQSSALYASSGQSMQAVDALAAICTNPSAMSASATDANLAGLMQMARTGVGAAGGQGNVSAAGLGRGTGAGYGSTNQDMGYRPGFSQSAQGSGDGPIVDKVGAYERIYDPTRLGDGGEISHVQGETHDGQTQQMQIGPGQGDLSGQVPYSQVIGEYREAAAQAMRRVSLPATMQDWVQRYFTSLVE